MFGGFWREMYPLGMSVQAQIYLFTCQSTFYIKTTVITLCIIAVAIKDWAQYICFEMSANSMLLDLELFDLEYNNSPALPMVITKFDHIYNGIGRDQERRLIFFFH